MSTLSTRPDPPRARLYRDDLPSAAVAGGRGVRLGAVFLRSSGYQNDVALSMRRHEPRHEGRSRKAVAYQDPAALARLTQCLADTTVADGTGVFRRDGSLWELGFGGTVVHMPDLKGLADIATLLANADREIHALDLSGGAGLRHGSVDVTLDGIEGDLGEVIDARTRAAYRVRVDELRAEIDDARLARDPIRAERAQLELAAITEQLEAAYGLGGRVRRSGDPAERARSAVTARIRAALRRVEAANPPLARHLHNSLRTGTWCVYAPETPVSWQL